MEFLLHQADAIKILIFDRGYPTKQLWGFSAHTVIHYVVKKRQESVLAWLVANAPDVANQRARRFAFRSSL